MWLPGGHLYVYLIYGMYYCANVVTESEGFPAAVLIRAALPVDGFEDPHVRLDGPGRFCRAMHITKEENGKNLVANTTLFISKEYKKPKQIQRAPRVGVDYAGIWANKPWRYIATY